jgi:hypothetical protein
MVDGESTKPAMYHRLKRESFTIPCAHRTLENSEAGKQISARTPRKKSAAPFWFGGGKKKSGNVSHEMAKIAIVRPN